MKRYKIKKESYKVWTKNSKDDEPTKQFYYNVFFGDLTFNSLNKKYISRIRNIIFDAKYAREYLIRHEEDADVTTHSTQKAFLVLMCEDKLSDD